MIKRALGSTGLRVSALGLGCNNFGGRLDSERTRLVVDAAIAAGITFIDTADAYGNRGGSERLLGETLGTRRKDVVLATKFGLPMDEAGRRRLARLCHDRGGREPETSQNRMDRPLLSSSPRSGDPDRGDAPRARRPGSARQGEVYGVFQSFWPAARRLNRGRACARA